MAGTGNIDKIRTLLKKAIDEIGSAAETLEDARTEAGMIGGKISEIVPKHIETQLDKLIAIAEGSDQSALLKLDELILNMPYRDLAPVTSGDRVKARTAQSGINLNPNTGAGPQSAVARQKTLQESYKEYQPDDRPYKGNGLSWEKLNESELFERSERDEFGLKEWTEPLDTFGMKQQIRERIENEDYEDLGEQLNESMDGRGHFDWKSMSSPIGSIGNTEFTSLRSTGRNGMDLKDITII